MLQIKVETGSGGILVVKMGYRKLRYIIFWECVVNIIRYFNVYGNTSVMDGYY